MLGRGNAQRNRLSLLGLGLPMSSKLTEKAIRFIEARNFAHVATLLPDGSPHVTPMWIDREGDIITVNTAQDRVKYGNITRDPRVAISITDQDDPYDRVVIQGRVVEVTEEGARDHINRLSKKYTGKDFPRIPGQVRVIIKIEPTKVID